MEQLTAQMQALSQEVTRLQAVAQAAEQRAAAAEAASVNPVLARTIAELPNQLKIMMDARQSASRQRLIDVRGLGKPPAFDNQERNYVVWSRKVESYVGGFTNLQKSLVVEFGAKWCYQN